MIFFARLVKEARRAKHTTRQVCINMVTQLPRELKTPLRRWITEKGDELTDEEGRAFIVEVRTVLAENGMMDDQGWRRVEPRKPMVVQKVEDTGSSQSRSRGVSRKPIMMVDSMDVETKESGLYPSSEDEQVNIVRRHGAQNSKFHPGRRSNGMECYTCGKRDHGWKFCPDRRCAICGERGHTQVRCHKVNPANGGRPKGHPSGDRDRVYQVGSGEEAVTIKVRVKGQGVAALLDTGAKPCVIDIGTLQRLGLESCLVVSPSRVHGLCSNPVEVAGFVDLPIEIGGHELFIQRLQVLESHENVFLLGRDF